MLRRDLGRIHRITREHGAQLLQLTYSAFPLPERPDSGRFFIHEHVNAVLREFGQQHQVALVDMHHRFQALLHGAVPRARFFASEQEDHPNPHGYAEIARLVADMLERPPAG